MIRSGEQENNIPKWTQSLIITLPKRDTYSSAREPQTGYIFAAYANLSIMFFQNISHYPFKKDVEMGR